MTNPSPDEIVDLFTFAEVTLVQHSTLAGHLQGITAANTKIKRKKVNKVEVVQEEPTKGGATSKRRDHTKAKE